MKLSFVFTSIHVQNGRYSQHHSDLYAVFYAPRNIFHTNPQIWWTVIVYDHHLMRFLISITKIQFKNFKYPH